MGQRGEGRWEKEGRDREGKRGGRDGEGKRGGRDGEGKREGRDGILLSFCNGHVHCV